MAFHLEGKKLSILMHIGLTWPSTWQGESFLPTTLRRHLLRPGLFVGTVNINHGDERVVHSGWTLQGIK